MFEPYMDHPNNEGDRLEGLYGEMLTEIGKHIALCIKEKHWGDDTYFDYLPTAIDFAAAYYATLSQHDMEFHITAGVANQATEVLGDKLVGDALKALNEVGALGAIHTMPVYPEEDHHEWYRQLRIDSKVTIDTDESSWIIEARPKK